MNKFWDYWKLNTTEKGQQFWQFSENEENVALLEDMQKAFTFDKTKNANSADLVYRYFSTKNINIQNKVEYPNYLDKENLYKETYVATKKGLNYYKTLITSNNFIAGDYGGPLFLLPGLIIVSYITNTPLAKSFQVLMKAYMFNQQNLDGGWGLHIEGASTMFGSCMNYVALRLLGESASSKKMIQAQQWIKNNGGATFIPSWGKFYLSALNVYDWKGCNSLFPEIWLLPKKLPIYPAKYWCHARMVYLPMAYCYGNKIKHPLNELTQNIRKEIYLDEYDTISWTKARNRCASTDQFRMPKPLMKVLHFITNGYEKFKIKKWRKKSLNFIVDYINAEDKHTNYINIGPVNQVLNSLAIWHRYGPDSEQFKNHVDRWKDYLWLAEDGMKMQGYNGAQFWETAFTINAINESEVGIDYEDTLNRLYQFVDISQIQKGIPKEELFFRHPNEGGWPFSTVEHAWPITDCTADGIKTVIKCHQFFRKHNLNDQSTVSKARLKKAIDLVLSFQTKDGGWASYEKRRAPFWIEALNPSEVFGEIMVDYSYTECSSSSIQALATFSEEYPDYKSKEVKIAIKNGIEYIKKQQGEDGSWYGSWGVCYTYAAWFALEALASAKEYYANSKEVKQGCAYLVSKQRKDGSWGESYESCVKMKYVQHEKGQIIHTAWALLALMQAKYPDNTIVDAGIQFLISRQEENGDFPQEGISGVFNKNCMETYTSYRNVFPIWALNRYLKIYK